MLSQSNDTHKVLVGLIKNYFYYDSQPERDQPLQKVFHHALSNFCVKLHHLREVISFAINSAKHFVKQIAMSFHNNSDETQKLNWEIPLEIVEKKNRCRSFMTLY